MRKKTKKGKKNAKRKGSSKAWLNFLLSLVCSRPFNCFTKIVMMARLTPKSHNYTISSVTGDQPEIQYGYRAQYNYMSLKISKTFFLTELILQPHLFHLSGPCLVFLSELEIRVFESLLVVPF
ncbi:hypothetical protein TWF751_006461 [Orbilia oligospora]|nr:hypothetical protein TWF751_006461 [Orbilia oligospora]